MFNKLPIEINILIYQYLDGITLKPFDKMSKKIMRSNEVWRENLYRKYSDKKKFYKKVIIITKNINGKRN